jgi:type I restriction enzyme, S subunit
LIYKSLPLSELSEIGDGNHSSNYPKNSEMVEEGVPFLRSGNIQDGKILDKNLKFISPEKHQNLKKGHIKTGDILFTNRGEIGKVGIVDERFDNANLNSQVAWIRVNNQLYNRYLYYYLMSSSTKLFFSNKKTGTALQQITIRQLKSLLINFPNFTEQQRIVSKIDKLLVEINELNKVTSSKISNINSFFDSILVNNFTNNKYKKMKLENLCTATQGVQISKNNHIKSPKKGYLRYLYISDFSHNKNVKFVENKFPKKIVKLSDIIVVNTGASAGNIFRGIEGILSNNLFKVETNQSLLNSDFLYYFVTSNLFKNFQKKIMRGTANPHMGHENFLSAYLNLPPLDIQNEAVLKFTELEKNIKNLKKNYFNKINLLNKLKLKLISFEQKNINAA